VQFTLAARPAQTTTCRVAPHIPELRIEAELVLLEIGREVLARHRALVGREEHPVEEREDPVDARQDLVGLAIALRDVRGDVLVTPFVSWLPIAPPVIRQQG